MSKDLKIQVMLSTIDKLTAPFKNAQKATKVLSNALKDKTKHLYDLKKEYQENEAATFEWL
ncbi:hypothetical protein NYR60_02620 [Actinobacillus genomosp. 2]|uniref:hypothetical protein n=1 Tax=Actinobacillus genomosp. 2 TaxID=230709 RepID=UPI002442FE1E|nr:hypothetical protein [Actinobacillus genomosp. 2]WGE32524.1 hypothetical protein NYR60_02620 [Actinobacillus genomosp. 2]